MASGGMRSSGPGESSGSLDTRSRRMVLSCGSLFCGCQNAGRQQQCHSNEDGHESRREKQRDPGVFRPGTEWETARWSDLHPAPSNADCRWRIIA